MEVTVTVGRSSINREQKNFDTSSKDHNLVSIRRNVKGKKTNSIPLQRECINYIMMIQTRIKISTASFAFLLSVIKTATCLHSENKPAGKKAKVLLTKIRITDRQWDTHHDSRSARESMARVIYVT